MAAISRILTRNSCFRPYNHHLGILSDTGSAQLQHIRLFSSQLWRRSNMPDSTDKSRLSNTKAPFPANPPPTILSNLTPKILQQKKENIYTLPNFLTTTRILTAPLIPYFLVTSQPQLAFAVFAYSSLTDLIDGYLARRFNLHTVLGSILDPFADKLLMTTSTISLWYVSVFPSWLVLLILGRDAGLALSALYFRYISLPPEYRGMRAGYWDFSLPSAEVRPTEISKINTLLQFLLVACGMALPVLPETLAAAWNLQGVFEGWMGLVAATTVWSGASYLFTRDAIVFLDRQGRPRRREDPYDA